MSGPSPLAQAATTDLGIAGINLVTARPVVGRPITLEVVVNNSSVCPDCGPIGVSYWDDSDDGNLSCGDSRTLASSSEIITNSSTTVRGTLNGYPRPGNYRAWFWVDCGRTVTDTNEANNVAYLDIEVIADPGDECPDGDCDSVDPPPDPPDDGGQEPPPPAPPDPPVVDPNAPEPAPAPTDPTAEDPVGPAFCGLFGTQSALGGAAWVGLIMLGLTSMKRRYAR